MLKAQKFFRIGKVIYPSQGQAMHFPSIAQAKRESFNIQKRLDGALGRGSLRIKR